MWIGVNPTLSVGLIFSFWLGLGLAAGTDCYKNSILSFISKMSRIESHSLTDLELQLSSLQSSWDFEAAFGRLIVLECSLLLSAALHHFFTGNVPSKFEHVSSAVYCGALSLCFALICNLHLQRWLHLVTYLVCLCCSIRMLKISLHSNSN